MGQKKADGKDNRLRDASQGRFEALNTRRFQEELP